MRRVLVSVIVLISTSVFVLPPVNAAAPKPGNKCTSVGTVAALKGSNFKCVRSGNKLIWKKVSKVSTKPKPPVIAPIPISLPVAPGSITFGNILENLDKVAQVAFESSQKTYSTNAFPPLINSTIWVGPNTVPVGPTSEADRINKAMKLWSGFNQPKTIGLFFFNTQDEPLAEIEYEKWRTKNNIKEGQVASYLRNECLSNNGPGAPVDSQEPLQDCRNANAGVINGNGTAIGFFGVPNEAGSRSDAYQFGALEIHEFTHMVQTAQFVGTSQQPGGAMQQVTPCWIQEGQAHFASKSTASSTLNDYLHQRNGEALNRSTRDGRSAPRDFEEISKYLSLETLATCQQTYNWGYATGMLAVEALSAIGGVQSTMALYAMEARGHTFIESFKLVYGISWNEAQPILARAVEKAYLQSNMSVS